MSLLCGAMSGVAIAQTPETTTPLPDGYFPEPRPLAKVMDRFDRYTERNAEKPPADGFYPEFGGMITGSGWFSFGPGYRHSIARGKGRVSVSGAASVRLYTMAQGRAEFPLAIGGVSLGTQALYRDSLQVNYFGLGNNTLDAQRSGYRLRTFEVTAFATKQRGPLEFSARAGVIPFVSISSMSGRVPDYPDTIAVFDDSAAPGINDPVSYVFADASVAFDTRVATKYPVSGGRYELRWATYSDRSRGRYSFQRYEAEASHFITLGSPRWGLAAEGWVVGTSAGDDQVVPFYVLPSLGGKNTVRGYPDYRFHDRALMLMSVESRWSIWRHVDAALFVDAGKVAPSLSGLSFRDLKPSVGVGVRLHNDRALLTRLDLGRGPEGWHLGFKMSHAFSRSRPDAGHRPAIPFVP